MFYIQLESSQKIRLWQRKPEYLVKGHNLNPYLAPNTTLLYNWNTCGITSYLQLNLFHSLQQRASNVIILFVLLKNMLKYIPNLIKLYGTSLIGSVEIISLHFLLQFWQQKKAGEEVIHAQGSHLYFTLICGNIFNVLETPELCSYLFKN